MTLKQKSFVIDLLLFLAFLFQIFYAGDNFKTTTATPLFLGLNKILLN